MQIYCLKYIIKYQYILSVYIICFNGLNFKKVFIPIFLFDTIVISNALYVRGEEFSPY